MSQRTSYVNTRAYRVLSSYAITVSGRPLTRHIGWATTHLSAIHTDNLYNKLEIRIASGDVNTKHILMLPTYSSSTQQNTAF